MRLEIENNINKLAKKTAINVGFCILYVNGFCFLAKEWIMPVYYSNQLYNSHVNETIMFILYISYVVMAFFLALHKNSVKSFFLWVLWALTILPLVFTYISLPEFHNMFDFVMMAIGIFIEISIICMVKINLNLNKWRMKILKYWKGGIVFFIFFVIYRYYYINGLSVFNLDFRKVYEYRFILRERMAGYLLYVDNWVMNIFNPCLCAYFLYKRKKFLFMRFVFMQILLFGFSSHKSVLLLVPIIVVIYLMSPIFLKRINYIPLFALSGIGSLFIFYYYDIRGMVLALVDRLFIIPSEVNFYYYKYFSENGFDYFKHSFFRHFYIDSADSLNIAYKIGKTFFNDESISANTGFIGSGYAQGGLPVLLIYGVIIAILINVIEAFTKKIPARLVLSFVSLPMLTLFISGDLPTTLLTGGMGVALILLYGISMEKHDIHF